ncbi:MAG TPA: hypothetical protein VM367_09540 [Pseudonocardia sp.]|nr:hypothetical protein [Pseudonocardia sp.]
MSVWQTVLFFVVPSVGLYLLLTLMVLVPRMSRRPRYRAGQRWPYPPMWWTANPEGAHLPDAVTAAGGERGGARGTW